MTYPKTPKGWKKCPSVTTGGKEWFYYHPDRMIWVVWSRFIEKWIVSTRDKSLLQIPESPNTFNNPTAALKAAQKHINETTTSIFNNSKIDGRS